MPRPKGASGAAFMAPAETRRPPYRFHVFKVYGRLGSRVISTFTREEAAAWVAWFEGNKPKDSAEKWEVRE